MKNRKSNSKEDATELSNKPNRNDKKTRSTGLEPGWLMLSAAVREEHLERLKALSFLTGISQKKILDRLLAKGLSMSIKPIPKMKMEMDELDRLLERTFTKEKSNK